MPATSTTRRTPSTSRRSNVFAAVLDDGSEPESNAARGGGRGNEFADVLADVPDAPEPAPSLGSRVWEGVKTGGNVLATVAGGGFTQAVGAGLTELQEAAAGTPETGTRVARLTPEARDAGPGRFAWLALQGKAYESPDVADVAMEGLHAIPAELQGATRINRPGALPDDSKLMAAQAPAVRAAAGIAEGVGKVGLGMASDPATLAGVGAAKRLADANRVGKGIEVATEAVQQAKRADLILDAAASPSVATSAVERTAAAKEAGDKYGYDSPEFAQAAAEAGITLAMGTAMARELPAGLRTVREMATRRAAQETAAKAPVAPGPVRSEEPAPEENVFASILRDEPGELDLSEPGAPDVWLGESPLPRQTAPVGDPVVDVLAEREFLRPDPEAGANEATARALREYRQREGRVIEDAVVSTLQRDPGPPRLRVQPEAPIGRPALDVEASVAERMRKGQTPEDVMREALDVGARLPEGVDVEALRVAGQMEGPGARKWTADEVASGLPEIYRALETAERPGIVVSRGRGYAGAHTGDVVGVNRITSAKPDLGLGDIAAPPKAILDAIRTGQGSLYREVMSAAKLRAEEQRANIARRDLEERDAVEPEDVTGAFDPAALDAPGNSNVLPRAELARLARRPSETRPSESRPASAPRGTERRLAATDVVVDRRRAERRAQLAEELPGVPDAALARIIDAEERVSAAEAAREAETRRADLDELTGVGSGSAYRRELQQHKARNTQPAAVTQIDAQGIGAVNNHPELGEGYADAILATTGRALQTAAGNRGRVFRKGGDEFVIHWNSPEEAAAGAPGVRKALQSAEVQVLGEDGKLLARWRGVDHYGGDGRDFAEASKALYAEKRNYRTERQRALGAGYNAKTDIPRGPRGVLRTPGRENAIADPAAGRSGVSGSAGGTGSGRAGQPPAGRELTLPHGADVVVEVGGRRVPGILVQRGDEPSTTGPAMRGRAKVRLPDGRSVFVRPDAVAAATPTGRQTLAQVIPGLDGPGTADNIFGAVLRDVPEAPRSAAGSTIARPGESSAVAGGDRLATAARAAYGDRPAAMSVEEVADVMERATSNRGPVDTTAKPPASPLNLSRMNLSEGNKELLARMYEAAPDRFNPSERMTFADFQRQGLDIAGVVDPRSFEEALKNGAPLSSPGLVAYAKNVADVHARTLHEAQSELSRLRAELGDKPKTREARTKLEEAEARMLAAAFDKANFDLALKGAQQEAARALVAMKILSQQRGPLEKLIRKAFAESC